MRRIAKVVAAIGGISILSIGSAAAKCVPGTNICFDDVPEINASAGLEAIALLVVAVLIVREVLVRRRQA